MALNRVVICGVNTARLPLLTDKEKDELFDRIEQGEYGCQRDLYQGQSATGSECDPEIFEFK